MFRLPDNPYSNKGEINMADIPEDNNSCKGGTQTKTNPFTPDPPHEMSHIKKVIGVISGKGGVGKSLVTSMLAVAANRQGYKTAIMDADITGPSIPKAFGINRKAQGNQYGLLPIYTQTGIAVMSVNLLLENETDPVVWRGPILANTVRQFWKDVVWGEVDYMFIDMPPGTGDIPLTVFQSIKIDGVIIVTSPQELVSMIVTKAVNMARMMDINIVGLIENFSYFTCPHCQKDHRLFGESHLEQIAQEMSLSVLAKLPIDPELAKACDLGRIEEYRDDYINKVISVLSELE
jgi:Mrp family chromosome partitioning ATPase